jgi:quercetin dioxygenase-like cupin family protein
VRILDLGSSPRRPVERFGSSGFAVAPLGRGAETHHVVLTLEPGGVIGRHPAVGRQLLVLLSGDATVSGQDGTGHPLGVGQAALWEPGESHETRSRSGMTAFVVEGGLDIDWHDDAPSGG